MNFNYKNYVTRYNYEPYSWPPDLGLAELHARCSEPGPPNHEGIECPCCQQVSKKKVSKWWKRSVDEDLKENGTAIPGYFHLLKYYLFFVVLVIGVNALYPIYATFYACRELDTQDNYCLKVGVLYYLEYRSMVQLLQAHNETHMIYILEVLQTTIFYVLLGANYLSIVFITFYNSIAKRELAEMKSSEASRCLVFYNIDKSVAQNLGKLLESEGDNMNIVRSMELYQIKRYYEYFQRRNKIYYHLLSCYVVAENPLRIRNLNRQLQQYHQVVLEEKEKFHHFSGRVMVMFEDITARKLVNSIYRLSLPQKWWYGFRSLLHEYKLCRFDRSQIRLLTYEIGLGSDVIWHNLGEDLDTKMAIRIKTFFVAVIFIVVCYLILYYPILFSLRTHIKAETQRFVKLNTFEKILPNLTSFALVGLSLIYRSYMDQLSEQRNPKDQLERARFVLITCLTFHVLFYIIIPTLFFFLPSEISDTVKLYVVAEQAKTFILVQIIIVLVDLPYRIWKRRKVLALSDQRVAFKNNQQMLHKLVECRDYPLEIRLQALFRIWSLIMFYAFFSAYMMFYVLVAFLVMFWIEKHNLYKHYAIKRKVSIKLESETLMYYVNFFCLYLCFIYCYTIQGGWVKIVAAVAVTLTGMATSIIYWLVLNKGDHSEEVILRDSSDLSKQASLLKKEKLAESAQKFVNTYHQFLQSIQNDQLDQEITVYLKKFKDYQSEREQKRRTQNIELQLYSENSKAINTDKQQSDQEQSQHQIESANYTHY